MNHSERLSKTFELYLHDGNTLYIIYIYISYEICLHLCVLLCELYQVSCDIFILVTTSLSLVVDFLETFYILHFSPL